MGGCFDSRTYEGKYTKDEILTLFKTDVEKALYDHGHMGYSGTIAEKGHETVTIKWLTKKFATPERAEKYIQENHEKWEPCMGAFYESIEGEGCVVAGWCSS